MKTKSIITACLLLFAGCKTCKKETPQKDLSGILSNQQISSPKVITPIKKNVKTKDEFCHIINDKFKAFKWNKIVCNPDRWEVYDYSKNGNPLFYQTFGFDSPNNHGPINLFLCGVHGNEPTAIYPCFHMVRELIYDNPNMLKDFKLIVAPIVNPDGFLADTRVNANGVDPNRNLPTKDWNKYAMMVWKKYKNLPAKFPGKSGGSEIESKFQVFLIDEFKPDKIVSLHAPYNFLDYDGPGDRKYYNLVRVEQRAKYLALNMQANSNKFLKVVDFQFFPGSLGNYAGNERKIPTYTLELPSVLTSKALGYWESLKYAIVKALAFKVYDGNEGNPFLRAQKIISEKLRDETLNLENKTPIAKSEEEHATKISK